MTAPFVVTSRLGNILQMISLSHQTGILRVIRGQGATREMGQIRFIDGEPVSALLGQLTGEAALGVLNNWGECHYAFDELSVADVASLTSLRNGAATFSGSTPDSTPDWGPGFSPGVGPEATPPFSPSNPSTSAFGPAYSPEYGSIPSWPSSTSPLSEMAWPIYSYQQSGLFSTAAGAPINEGGAPSGAQSPSFPSPSFPSSLSPSVRDAQPWLAPMQGATQSAFQDADAAGSVVSTALLTLAPQRAPIAERIDHLPLDRRERMVLLLVDGRRTVADLMRLTRRTEMELQAVLTHLELLGLVSLGG